MDRPEGGASSGGRGQLRWAPRWPLQDIPEAAPEPALLVKAVSSESVQGDPGAPNQEEETLAQPEIPGLWKEDPKPYQVGDHSPWPQRTATPCRTEGLGSPGSQARGIGCAKGQKEGHWPLARALAQPREVHVVSFAS